MKSALIIAQFIFTVFAGLCQTNTFPFPSTGNVGIGTTTPSYPLEIADHSTGHQLRVLLNSNATDDAYIGFQFNGVNGFKGGLFRNKSTDNLSIWTGFSGTVPAMTVLSQNNFVGIGTTNPTAQLHVESVDLEQIKAIGTGISRSGFYTQNTNANGQPGFVMENERGEFASYGAFAIGGSQNNWSPMFGLTRNDKVFVVADGASNLGMGVGTLRAQPLVLGTNSQERLRIDADGNIAIGTSDPNGYKLAVNGSAIFTKIKVKHYSSWPDYVFHKNYKLRTLHELEVFIKQNSHLPEIPSAAELKEMELI